MGSGRAQRAGLGWRDGGIRRSTGGRGA
eukprot:COSAG03_NODE_12424_length_548_cov_1.048998_1_plen_27_part_10